MNIIILCDWPGSSSYHNEILQGINNYCTPRQINLYTLSLGQWDSQDPYNYNRYYLYNLLKTQAIDGIISFTATINPDGSSKDYLEYIQSLSKAPIVSMVETAKGIPSVLINEFTGLEALVKHLIKEHGYTRFAYIAGMEKGDNTRENCIKTTLRAAGLTLPKERIYQGDWSIQGGKKAFLPLMEQSPEVIMCANDHMALGAFEEARSRGYMVPEDIAITGYDNMQLQKYMDLPFSTVKQPLTLLGYKAAENLHKIISGQWVTPREIIPSKVIIRRTCGCQQEKSNTPKTAPQPPRKYQWSQECTSLMNKTFIEALSSKDKNLIIRKWNRMMFDVVQQDIPQSVLWITINTLVKNWQKELKDAYQYDFLLWTLEKLIRISMDYYQEAEIFHEKLKNEQIERLQVSADIFNSQVLNSMSLDNKEDLLINLFQNADIQNAFLLLFPFDDHKPDTTRGRLIFGMEGRKTVPVEGFQNIDLRDPFLPGLLQNSKHYNLVWEVLFDANQQYGLLIHDLNLNPDLGINEYLRRRFSLTLKAYIEAKLIQESKKRLEKEIDLRSKSEKQIRLLLKELEKLSLKDEMTELYNRRGFLTIGEKQIKQYLRENKSFLVIFCDMDGLKSINDTYGHQEGDRAILAMSQVLVKTFREADVIARLGGDEFTLLLGNACLDNLKTIKKRLELNLSQKNQELKKAYRIDISWGYCSSENLEEIDLAKMMDLADSKLYAQKKRKKNDIRLGFSL